MREFAFILVVALILLFFTAIRYRKQISGVIGFARMLREAVDPNRARKSINQPAAKPAGELVNCNGCGTWVPRERAIRFDARTFYCSKECVKMALAEN